MEGRPGKDGSGLPTGGASNFMFATGIECSYPTIQNGRVRRDQLAECGHYEHWRKDLSLVRDLGLKVLRYGLPYHLTHLGPGRYDFAFADEVMAEMRRLEITPILDLHAFRRARLARQLPEPRTADPFQRLRRGGRRTLPLGALLHAVNEIYVTARISRKDGQWNEQLKTDRGFVTAMKHLVASSILATHKIAERRPNAVIVQSESAEYIHEAKATQSQAVKLANKQRFISLDLLYAHAPDADILLYLMDNGLTREEYDWFMQGEPPGYQIMGNDYYGRNEHILKPDGTMCPAEDVMGWYQITKEYYERYKKPVMHTETNTFDADAAPSWLWKQWINVLRMRADGVPVLGFNWYSLVDQIDWDTNLAEERGTVNACGLYDLQRQPRPVAAAYRALLEEFGQITIVPHGEVFEVTDQPAQLKIEV
jgi:beta-glucosidase/6-phospho-beta-glucosidase/beta-galactosidase